MGVANLMELADANTLGNLLSSVASPAFVKTPVMMNHVHAENMPSGTNVLKLRKKDFLTAAALAESTALAPDANGELVEGSLAVSVTATKCAVVSGLTLEEQKFGDIDFNRVGDEHFTAIGRFVDNDALSLFSGLSTSVTAASVTTVDDLMLAQMTIYAGNVPSQNADLTFVGAPRAVYNIKKEMIQGGNAAFTNPAMLDVFRGEPVKANGFIGKIPGVCDVYQTTGLATSGGDDVNALFHPMWTFGGIFDSAPLTWVTNVGAGGFYTEIASAYFHDIAEWNDAAGVKILSDT